jgi:glycosyltransferase involved in cell wall biosynthesis
VNPIKICHIVNLITGKSDGVYSHLKMIFQNYDINKFEHYLVFQGGEKVEKEILDLGIKIFVIPSLKKKVSLGPFIDVYKILKINEIDIIHTHLVKPYAIVGLLNILLRKKFIFNYHGLFIAKNPYYGFAEKSIYKTIHRIINLFNAVNVVLVPSAKSKELLIEETKLFPEPIVYYNGYSLEKTNSKVDKDLLQKILELKKKYFIMAVIGRLERQKRIDIALELFRSVSLKNKQLFLMIFGDGILKNQLIKMSSELGISSRVIFFDYVPDVVNYLQFIDILLFTSDWEGMPLSMWEAMANQVPVVAPDVGGFKEILEENNCGLIYEPGNLKDAEEKILQLINDEQLRTKLGQNGKSAIEIKYNEKEFIQQIERVYFQLMSQ